MRGIFAHIILRVALLLQGGSNSIWLRVKGGLRVTSHMHHVTMGMPRIGFDPMCGIAHEYFMVYHVTVAMPRIGSNPMCGIALLIFYGTSFK